MDDLAQHEALNARAAATEANVVALEARMTAIEASVSALRQLLADARGDEAATMDHVRISSLEGRADASDRRADASEMRAGADRDRIWALEGRANVDAILIAELQAEGVIAAEHAANLELALHSSRSIGAAIGILMARHNIVEADAFAMLRKSSMDCNRRLRELAEEVVSTGELPHHGR